MEEKVNLLDKESGITKETLNVIFLLDNSYSMKDSRLMQLNSAMPNVLERMKEIAEDENVNVKIRIISFSDRAKWEVGQIESGEDVEDVIWEDLRPLGGTNTSEAIYEACKSLKKTYLGHRALHPVVILVTDGESNEPQKTLEAISELKKKLAGGKDKEKVTRIAIGVEEYSEPELNAFASMGHIIHTDGTESNDVPLVFKVDDAEELSRYINCAAVSSMYSSITGDADSGIVIEEEDSDNDDKGWVD